MNMSWAMRASDSFPSSTLFKLVCESSISCTCDIFSYVFSISSFSSDISTYIYCLMHLFFFLWRWVFSRYLSFLLWNKDGRLRKDDLLLVLHLLLIPTSGPTHLLPWHATIRRSWADVLALLVQGGAVLTLSWFFFVITLYVFELWVESHWKKLINYKKNLYIFI